MSKNMLFEEQLEIINIHQTSAPVHMVPIANDLGLDVFSVPSWPDSMSGMIRKEGDDCKIYVNKSHFETRRRFTIAHEIAHFILHKDLIGDGIVDDALYRSNLSNKIEAQANSFAAEILMPWDLLNKYLPTYNNVSDLARIFNVSKSAMSIRLGVPYETHDELCTPAQPQVATGG